MKPVRLVNNTASAKQKNRAQHLDQQKREQQIADIKTIMSSAEGRRFLYRVIHDLCGINRSSYLSNLSGRGSDPAFVEGQRHIGLQLLNEMQNICFEKWMLAEAERYEAEQACNEIAELNEIDGDDEP